MTELPPLPSVVAQGAPLPRKLAAALREIGVRFEPAAVAAATLIVTRRAAAPARPSSPRPWLWLPPGSVAIEAAAAATLAGAYDVIPCDAPAAAERIARRLGELGEPAPAPVLAEASGIVAASAATRAALAAIARAARTSMPVLLTGETGTGKDLAARLLHQRSARAHQQFVPINCAAIPNELIEAELFGYVRRAFSGAVHDYDGQLTAAAGGTVFLDEVDDTPKTLQVKLLRVLEDRVVSRLGENEWHRVDFRVVAATNRDLAELVRRGEFGGDLYQRLAIVQIHMPPLRDRLDDLPALVAHFVERFRGEEPGARPVRSISPAALAVMARYPWPGNVRELRNVVFHSLVGKRGGDELLLSDLPEHVVRGQPADAAAAGGAIIDDAALAARLDAGRLNLRALRDQLERTALGLALERAGGSPARAARLLGEVGRGGARDPGGTVRAMMRRLGV